MSKDTNNFYSLDILFKTPQGKQVLTTFFNTWDKTKDIFQAYDVAKEETDRLGLSLPLQIFGFLDFLKIISIIKPEILMAIMNMIADILFPTKTKRYNKK